MPSDDNILDGLESLGSEVTNSERMHRMKRVMRSVYREEFERKKVRLPPIRAQSMIVVLSIISVIVFGVTTLYNFNRFITLEERVFSALGHVEDALQRRANLFDNLVNLALNHARLEQQIFRHVAEVRARLTHAIPPHQRAMISGGQPIGAGALTPGVAGADAAGAGATAAAEAGAASSAAPDAAAAGAEGAGTGEAGTGGAGAAGATDNTAGGANAVAPQPGAVDPKLAGLEMLKNPLAKLMAIVEQYPNVQFSNTYQQLMEKLMDIENRIAQRRDEYNQEVRVYNTLISSFPWNVLATITNFHRYEYFRAEDHDRDKRYRMPINNGTTQFGLAPMSLPATQGGFPMSRGDPRLGDIIKHPAPAGKQ